MRLLLQYSLVINTTSCTSSTLLHAEKRCYHHYTFIANKQMCAVAGMPCACNVSCNSGNAGSIYSSVRVGFVYGEK